MTNTTRGDMFVRVTEMRPFTEEHKIALSTCISSMIEQNDIHKIAQPKSHQERVVIIENTFKTMMEYPEFLAKYAKFRVTSEAKLDEIKSEIKKLNFPESIVLNDAKYYMKMLAARPDYIEYNCFLHGFVNDSSNVNRLPIVNHIPKVLEKPKSTHSYNLRSRAKRARYEY